MQFNAAFQMDGPGEPCTAGDFHPSPAQGGKMIDGRRKGAGIVDPAAGHSAEIGHADLPGGNLRTGGQFKRRKETHAFSLLFRPRAG